MQLKIGLQLFQTGVRIKAVLLADELLLQRGRQSQLRLDTVLLCEGTIKQGVVVVQPLGVALRSGIPVAVIDKVLEPQVLQQVKVVTEVEVIGQHPLQIGVAKAGKVVGLFDAATDQNFQMAVPLHSRIGKDCAQTQAVFIPAGTGRGDLFDDCKVHHAGGHGCISSFLFEFYLPFIVAYFLWEDNWWDEVPTFPDSGAPPAPLRGTRKAEPLKEHSAEPQEKGRAKKRAYAPFLF